MSEFPFVYQLIWFYSAMQIVILFIKIVHSIFTFVLHVTQRQMYCRIAEMNISECCVHEAGISCANKNGATHIFLIVVRFA